MDKKIYKKIEQIVSNIMEDYNIFSLPIDIFDLAKKMQIYDKSLDKYSYLDSGSSLESCIIFKPSCGDSKFINGSITLNCNDFRERFTKAHEIGHIALDTKKQTLESEQEANYFARYLLAPSCLILCDEAKDYLLNTSLVQNIFQISKKCADHVTDSFRKRISFKDLFKLDHEKIIINHLKDSLLLRIKCLR